MALRLRPRSGLLLTLALVSFVCLARADQPSQRWEVVNKDGTGGFITALAQDLTGNIWVGTEDKGVFRYTPSPLGGEGRGEGKWTQFNSKNGLADDNAYAIAVDRYNRVWVGTLNHGVSVFSGERGESSPRCWKNYDVLDGPIGERIFAITTCPTDGDVWMATSAGLTRYSLKAETWSYYTRADGLPEDQANAIAFDPQGNIYVGTQCHGIAIGTPSPLGGEGKGEGYEYKKWTVAVGPTQMPLTPTGTGLPTNLINGLVVSREGTIFAATTAGLAWSKDKGKTWNYLRGKDYAAKVKGRFGGAPVGWKEAPKAVMETLLPEDYVTCVAEDDTGLIWLGFRQQGYLAIDPKTSKHVFEGNKKAEGLPDDYVFTILPTVDSRPWVGTYGGGVGRAKQAMKGPGAKGIPPAIKPPDKPAPLPTAAKPPTVGELNAMLTEVAKVQASDPKQHLVHELTDDWRTQGTWIDRYGSFSGVLCAMAGGGNDLTCGYRDAWFTWKGSIGRHCTKGDALRRWVHWISTENPRSLQNPLAGGRKQSEWDDHGETYSMSHYGPHVYGSFKLPKGQYLVALYIFNKDGHDGMNRFRDYLVELKPTAISKDVYAKLGKPGVDVEGAFESLPQASVLRVNNFWGGVYKRCYINVAGPSLFTVRINRNNSFNTILSSIFVDVLGEMGPNPELQLINARTPNFRDSPPKQQPDDGEVIARFMDRLLTLRESNTGWYARNSRRYLILLMRTLLRAGKDGSCLAQELENKGLYRGLKQDVALCLNDLQLFERRDRVHCNTNSYATYAWSGRSSAEPEKPWMWDWKEYRYFLREQQSKESWEDR